VRWTWCLRRWCWRCLRGGCFGVSCRRLSGKKINRAGERGEGRGRIQLLNQRRRFVPAHGQVLEDLERPLPGVSVRHDKVGHYIIVGFVVIHLYVQIKKVGHDWVSSHCYFLKRQERTFMQAVKSTSHIDEGEESHFDTKYRKTP
jgi:hypothetical protein